MCPQSRDDVSGTAAWPLRRVDGRRSLLIVTPSHICNPSMAIAAVRAGEIGLLDLGIREPEKVRRQAIEHLIRFADGRGTWGVRWDTLGDVMRIPASLSERKPQRLPLLLLAGMRNLKADSKLARQTVAQARGLAVKILLEVTDIDAALQTVAMGFDGVVIKACEAGGEVSSKSSFILLQRLFGRLKIPFWIQGAWGTDTAAAAYLAGATGIVLGEELWQSRESPLSAEDKGRMAHFDGTETVCLDVEDHCVRFLRPSNPSALADLEQQIAAAGVNWPEILRAGTNGATRSIKSDRQEFLPLGQGIAYATSLASRYVTVGGILAAFRKQVDDHISKVARQKAFAADSPLAQSVGTRYPIFQGPMTRVSDVAPFADAVAENGALPFLALALMRGPEVHTLMKQTASRLGDKPWGIGILGFVPPALRKEQLEVVSSFRPGFAIIAGGRPSQAAELEKRGIATYLHVPSPGLLGSFVEQGARRFIFEGRECGGHVGPRTSFMLWQSAIDVLLNLDIKQPEAIHVLFAGGIHDEISSAMVASLAVPLAQRGMKIGVLLGTAYLFTDEAVQCGAISRVYQDEVIRCRQTTLLTSSIGHATRCAQTPFAEEFQARRGELLEQGRPTEEIRLELEMLNVGRLRMAAKGLARSAGYVEHVATQSIRDAAERRLSAEGIRVNKGENASIKPSLTTNELEQASEMLNSELMHVSEKVQREHGLYMVGEVAALRGKRFSMAELHEAVTSKSLDLATELAGRARNWRPVPKPEVPHEPIAIIGMACRFPSSPDLRTYWQNILNRFNAVREVPPERWSADLYYSPERFERDKIYSKWGSFLEESRFDPIRHRIPPASIPSIDPVQLLALDVSHDAIEDAGYLNRPFPRERTATIFASGAVADHGISYAFRTLMPQFLQSLDQVDEGAKLKIIQGLNDKLPEWTEDSFPGFLANVLSGRIANHLDLQGPNFVVDAACAASLAAVQIAVEQLRTGRCDMALVGAADGTNNAFTFMSFAKTHALTPSGKPRPFDDRADGIVLGEGVAVVVLKRLSDAERDGDHIYAVIRGIGSSSDGRNRSLTAPHTAAQALAIERAYAEAQVEPQTVSLIEAHATGTPVGDLSEINAMKQAFGLGPDAAPFCAVGSVKSMIGHTKTAAGLASLLKTTLALDHKVLPPTINVEVPNRKADLEHSPFYINTETRPWINPRGEEPRRAGVNAFGFGGTNFHLVVEEYTGSYTAESRQDLSPRPVELFLWRRESAQDLIQDLSRLHGDLVHAPEVNLAQLAYSHFQQEAKNGSGSNHIRLAVAAASVADLSAKLEKTMESVANGRTHYDATGLCWSREKPFDPGQVCFLYPGQGAQHVNMLKDLVQFGPLGPGLLEEANEMLADLLPRPLTDYLYPQPVFNEEAQERLRAAVNDTRIAQPLIGLVSLYATDILQRFGLHPAFTAGHSYGEYVALCTAGLYTRGDLLRLSVVRGRMIYEACKENPGTMAAVAAAAETTSAAIEHLGLAVELANMNAPKQTIIAGTVPAIDEAVKKLSKHGLAARRIPVTAAFHTSAMEKPAKEYAEHIAKAKLTLPHLPVYSNTSAAPYPKDLAAIRQQLVAHLARPVRFVEQIQALHEDGARLFLEAGPGRILTGLVSRILEKRPHHAIALDRPGHPGWETLGRLLAKTFALGLPIDPAPWYEGRGLQSVKRDDCLRLARQAHEGRPTDWILSPRAARPVRPLRDTATARKQPPTVKTSEVRALNDIPSSLDKMTETPSQEMNSTGGNPLPTKSNPLEPPRAQSELGKLQETMNHWLELQKEQLKLSERFLSIQDKVASGLLNQNIEFPNLGDSSAPPTTNAGDEAPRSSASSAADPVALTVAPAPVLPPLPEFQRTSAIESAPSKIDAVEDTGSAQSLTLASKTVRESGMEAVRPGAESFQRDLIEEVSRRTGYPEEMLDLDAQLEAELGIDSIKTMEIFSALKQYHHILAEEGQPEEEFLVQFTQLKTLRDIIDRYTTRLQELQNSPASPQGATGDHAAIIDAGSPATPRPNLKEAEVAFQPEQHESNTTGMAEASPVETAGRVTEKPHDVQRPVVERLTLSAVEAPELTGDKLATEGIVFPRNDSILILGEANELTSSLRAALTGLGIRAIQVVPKKAQRRVSTHLFEADLTSTNGVRELISAIGGAESIRVGGLVNCLTLSKTSRKTGLTGPQAPLRLVQMLMNVTQVLEEPLRSSGCDGGGWLVNLTMLDGKFGTAADRALPVVQAGSLGFFKSLAREWPDVRVKNIDLDPNADPKRLIVGLLQELSAQEDRLEVGLDGQRRWYLKLQKADRKTSRNGSLKLPFDDDATFLVTGGARGITAEILKRLTLHVKPRLVIVGRSSLTSPAEEPDEIRAAKNVGELRAAFLEMMRSQNGVLTPAKVEQRVQAVLRQREIHANVDALGAAGCEVEYHSLDIRNGRAFGALIEKIYQRFGRIDGVLHGAGLVEDRLLKDKTPDSFARVFETKVNSALVLAHKLQPENLKFMVLFSSVSGRFGNIGQTDYSAANEYLNKLAAHLDREWPGRVVAINWGPWDAGMLSDGLRALYKKRGIEPIPVDLGADSLLRELAETEQRHPEIVLTCTPNQIANLGEAVVE